MANIEDSPQSSGNETVKAQKEVTHTLPLSESLRKVIKDKSRLLFIKLQENTYKIKTCTPSPPIRPTYTLQNWGAQPLPIASDARQLFENLFFFTRKVLGHPKQRRATYITYVGRLRTRRNKWPWLNFLRIIFFQVLVFTIYRSTNNYQKRRDNLCEEYTDFIWPMGLGMSTAILEKTRAQATGLHPGTWTHGINVISCFLTWCQKWDFALTVYLFVCYVCLFGKLVTGNSLL